MALLTVLSIKPETFDRPDEGFYQFGRISPMVWRTFGNTVVAYCGEFDSAGTPCAIKRFTQVLIRAFSLGIIVDAVNFGPLTNEIW